MKKFNYLTIFLASSLLTVLGCKEDNELSAIGESEKKIPSQNNARIHNPRIKSVVDYSKDNYQGQLQYLKGDYNSISSIRVENQLDSKISDPNIDWTYFDGLYTESLSITEKQYLAYAVLVKKDLLAEFKNSPSQTEAEAILKYTNMLVQTGYYGYCLMYNCLETLKNQNFVFANISDLKHNIVNNTTAKQYHEGAIQHLSNYPDDPGSKRQLQKLNEDFSYLERISLL